MAPIGDLRWRIVQPEWLIVSTTYADGTGDEDSDRRRNAFIQLAGTDPGGDCRFSCL